MAWFVEGRLLGAFVALVMYVLLVASWQEDVQPHRFVTLADYEVKRFYGNRSYIDYFKLLATDGKSLLVGARNIVYNVSLHDLTENKPIEWYSHESHIVICQLKGKSEDDCQNYIRVLAKYDDKVLVCGTNAFKPVCRYYIWKNGDYEKVKDIPGQGLCPYDPNHNSTAIYADGELYAGTVSDFSATDPLIYRKPLRTEQYDPKYLNVPNFVSSISIGDYVYFFFRETAMEYINCGKIVYSRVARVCKRDQGGLHKFANRWTSFLLARLNCSIGGEFPFYFNEIQSTSSIVEGEYGGKKAQLIYGIFTTPPNSISGSAVCAFRMDDIINTFDGPFKEQENMNSNWLPVSSSKVPEPRPGQCVNDSRMLPDAHLKFIKGHPLMDQSVPAFWGHPIAIHTSLQYRFTQIDVDPQVKTPDGKTYDVLFIGTDNGKVLKAVNAESPYSDKYVNTVIIEEIQVFPKNVSINNLRVYRNKDTETGLDEGHLIVVSNDEIQAIKLQRCYSDKIRSCSECVALQDPYCAWDEKNQKCTSAGSSQWSARDGFLQNVALGYHPRCPNGIASLADIPRYRSVVTDHHTSVHLEKPCLPCVECVCSDSNNRLDSLDNDFSTTGVPIKTLQPFAQNNPSRPGRPNDAENTRPTFDPLAGTDDKANNTMP